MSLQLEDLTLTLMPVNIPGTFDEYPNWRRKLDTDVDALFNEPEYRKLLDAFVLGRKA